MRDSKASRAVEYAAGHGYEAQPDGSVIGPHGYLLKLRHNIDGYLTFNTRPSWSKYNIPVFVHRLVAYQKFGKQALDLALETRHLNNDKEDNRWDNIALGTPSENRLDTPQAERISRARRAGRARSPLVWADVQDIRDQLYHGATYNEIIARYGVARSTVSYIANNKTWRVE